METSLTGNWFDTSLIWCSRFPNQSQRVDWVVCVNLLEDRGCYPLSKTIYIRAETHIKTI